MSKKKIAIISTFQPIKHVEPLFVKYLGKKKNLYTIFIVPTKEDKNFYDKKYPNYFDEIIIQENEFDILQKKVDYLEIKKAALDIENKLGTSIYRLFMTNRTLGVGFYASGGYRHPKTRLHNKYHHNDMLKIAVSTIKFWDTLLKRNGVQLVINIPDFARFMAKKYDICVKILQTGKFGNTQYWTSDLFLQPENMEKYFKNLKGEKFEKTIIKSAYDSYFKHRKIHINNFKFSKVLKSSLLQFTKRCYGKFKGYRKGKNIYAFDEFLYIWRRRSDYKKLKRLTSITRRDIKQYNYIYFPLIAEPEVALHGIAKDFFFQLSSINMIARDLPANYRLVVKEHLLAIGRRPKDFYDQIRDLKNVLIADPLDMGIDYIKGSKAVACVTGTAGWEAVVMGIPVISFSKNNVYNFLDHVFHVSYPDETSTIIKKIVSNNTPNTKSIRDGSCFYSIFMNNSFSIGSQEEFISWPQAKSEEDNLRKYAKLLVEKLF